MITVKVRMKPHDSTYDELVYEAKKTDVKDGLYIIIGKSGAIYKIPLDNIWKIAERENV